MAHPAKKDEDKYCKLSLSIPPDLYARLIKYCEEEERTAAYVGRKAFEQWLKEKGY